MTNDEIAETVVKLMDMLDKKPNEAEAKKLGAAILINVLQNLNDIAEFARSETLALTTNEMPDEDDAIN